MSAVPVIATEALYIPVETFEPVMIVGAAPATPPAVTSVKALPDVAEPEDK